ncbi:MAG: sigma factor [Bacteroidales bacterium]|nr:sigma factor [Bacteroidales bacterium]
MSNHNTIEQELKRKFEEVFRENLHKVQFIARHYLKDFDASKDVAQEVFSTLWQKRQEINFSRPILPYLSVLTKNRCLNILKNQKIQP